ncbi:MAG: amidohydrolase family protein [Gemmatimonadota bacterium]|nr:MAG: amidohydrolase family protein [Gemmatimonadota bacterium]
MKTTRSVTILVLAVFFGVAGLAAQAIAIRGGTVHTLAGPAIEGGTVVIENGLITAVGTNVSVPAGAQIVDATGLHVYPGLFDAMSRLGLTEVGAVDVTNDYMELGDYNPHLLAMTAVHPASEHIPVARANGITHTVAAPNARGGGIGGQGSLIHLDGWTVEEMVIEPSVGLILSWPSIQTRRFDYATYSSTERSFREAREEYEADIKELEGWLEGAHQYKTALQAGIDVERDLKLEALVKVIDGELPFLVSANSEREINDALDFASENGVRMVLVNGREAWKVAERLADENVPVILGPTQTLPRNEDWGYDQMYAVPGQLYSAGVKFCFASFSASASRNLPYEAGNAVGYGLPQEEALRALTINSAEILGVGDRLGTIEPGKIGNLVVTDGDPIEIRTQFLHLVVNGLISSSDNKHKSLYERYRARPQP